MRSLILYWHRRRLKREIAEGRRHNHPIGYDSVDWVTGNVLKPCGCEAPAEAKLGLAFHDPRFYALNFIMWFGLLIVAIISAIEHQSWHGLLLWVPLDGGGMAISVLGLRSFLR